MSEHILCRLMCNIDFFYWEIDDRILGGFTCRSDKETFHHDLEWPHFAIINETYMYFV